jgi:anthranilate phosphoribosyltransferase
VISEYTISPEDFGVQRADAADVRVGSIEESKAMLLQALENKPGAPRDIVALNAGASIYIAGLAETLAAGVAKARTVLESGGARRKVDEFVERTRAV